MTCPVTHATLPEYPFPDTSQSLWNPPRELERARHRRIVEVALAGESAWLLTQHEDIRAVLADGRFVPHIPGVPMTPEQASQSGLLFLMHGAPHARLRRTLARALSARRVAALRPEVEDLARTALVRIANQGPPIDLMRGYAAPLATGTLSRLLGVGLADRPGFEAMIADSQALFGTTDPQDAARHGERFAAFLATLIAERRADPGDDLLSDLITRSVPDGIALTDAELHGLTFSLLGAGLVPPAQALLLATLRLLRSPHIADQLRRDLGQVPAAVEELLRLDPGGAASTDRALRATVDVELAGVRVSAGDIVVFPFGGANRDPVPFPDPHTPRLDRAGGQHLTFAPGVHHCLGAALARLQLEIGLGTLLSGLPNLTLAVEDSGLDWQHGMLGARNLQALPVTWPPSERAPA